MYRKFFIILIPIVLNIIHAYSQIEPRSTDGGIVRTYLDLQGSFPMTNISTFSDYDRYYGESHSIYEEMSSTTTFRWDGEVKAGFNIYLLKYFILPRLDLEVNIGTNHLFATSVINNYYLTTGLWIGNAIMIYGKYNKGRYLLREDENDFGGGIRKPTGFDYKRYSYPEFEYKYTDFSWGIKYAYNYRNEIYKRPFTLCIWYEEMPMRYPDGEDLVKMKTFAFEIGRFRNCRSYLKIVSFDHSFESLLEDYQLSYEILEESYVSLGLLFDIF